MKEYEITIEINPGTTTKEKLEIYQKAGINRLSIGLQSIQEHVLKVIGRIHDYEKFEEVYRGTISEVLLEIEDAKGEMLLLEEILHYIDNVCSEKENRHYDDNIMLDRNITVAECFYKIMTTCGDWRKGKIKWIPDENDMQNLLFKYISTFHKYLY